MTVGELKEHLATLPQYLNNKTLKFCFNPSKDICQEFVIEKKYGCNCGKNDVIFYLSKVGE